MRRNLPVTNREQRFADNASIVSKTDTKGRITYINRTFVEVSGFSEEELIGQPHNMVRHPDMPPAAFADFWHTLKAGRPWRGLVKNRCKNGDYYWVEANANPIRENGEVIGYMSLRTCPTRDQVEQAERIYRSMRDDARCVYTLDEGRIVRRGLIGRIQRATQLGVRQKLYAVLTALATTSLICFLLGWIGIRTAGAAMTTMYEDRLVTTGQIADILQRTMDSRMLLLDAIGNPSPERISRLSSRIAQSDREIEQTWQAYLSTYLTAEEQRLADQWQRDRNTLSEAGLKTSLRLLQEGDADSARQHADAFIDDASEAVREGAANLMQLQRDVASQ
jgi:methyl-accepting chemotaxis protein